MIGVLVKCINFFQLTYLQVCTEQWWWPLVLLLLGLQLLVHVWLLVGQCHWPILTTKLNYFITVCFTVYCVLTCNTKKFTLFHLSVNAWCPLIGGGVVGRREVCVYDPQAWVLLRSEVPQLFLLLTQNTDVVGWTCWSPLPVLGLQLLLYYSYYHWDHSGFYVPQLHQLFIQPLVLLCFLMLFLPAVAKTKTTVLCSFLTPTMSGWLACILLHQPN